MTWWQAMILGVVEGVTEYLPVSSTGHLILTAWLLGFADSAERWDAAFTFNIVIQAGAIAAVLGLYWKRVRQMSMGLIGQDPDGLRVAITLIVAFLPAAVLGLLLHGSIKEHLNGAWPVLVALFLGGVLMIVVARVRQRYGADVPTDANDESERNPDDTGDPRELEGVTLWMALLIGLAQCVAMWPGTSRSMMVLVACLLLGMRAKAAAEFTFLLGLITLGAATVYEGVKDGPEMVRAFGVLPLVIGFIAATASAALAVKWFVGFLTRHGLEPFGWYRLVVAGVFAAVLAMGWGTVPGAPDQPAGPGVEPAAPVGGAEGGVERAEAPLAAAWR